MLLRFVTPVMWAKFEAGRAKLAAQAPGKKETGSGFLNFKETEETGRGKQDPNAIAGSERKKENGGLYDERR